MNARAAGRILLFSDAHLGMGSCAEESEKVRKLHSFLDAAEKSCDMLFIMGDLFDFWFEYRHVIPKGQFSILARLHQMVRGGLPIIYLGGNHDFWIGDFLEREIGIEVHQEPIERILQGRRAYLAHGDGLARGDRGYKVMKRILRHPLPVRLFRLVHPDLGIALAHATSHTSHQYTKERETLVESQLEEVAERKFAEGYDLVVFAHLHRPLHRAQPAHDFVILGDWVTHFTYAVIEGGTVRLERWEEEAAAQ
jgi:UDP-2,3-diacylglucosamine hydrolase